jgi:hypothetical protein
MVDFLVRLILFLLGLAVAASLVAAMLLLALVWALRYAWARLTGRPAQVWVMRFDPRDGFNRFRSAGRSRTGPSAADVVNARARGEDVGSPGRLIDEGGGVTDVDVKPRRGD